MHHEPDRDLHMGTFIDGDNEFVVDIPTLNFIPTEFRVYCADYITCRSGELPYVNCLYPFARSTQIAGLVKDDSPLVSDASANHQAAANGLPTAKQQKPMTTAFRTMTPNGIGNEQQQAATNNSKQQEATTSSKVPGVLGAFLAATGLGCLAVLCWRSQPSKQLRDLNFTRDGLGTEGGAEIE